MASPLDAGGGEGDEGTAEMAERIDWAYKSGIATRIERTLGVYDQILLSTPPTEKDLLLREPLRVGPSIASLEAASGALGAGAGFAVSVGGAGGVRESNSARFSSPVVSVASGSSVPPASPAQLPGPARFSEFMDPSGRSGRGARSGPAPRRLASAQTYTKEQCARRYLDGLLAREQPRLPADAPGAEPRRRCRTAAGPRAPALAMEKYAPAVTDPVVEDARRRVQAYAGELGPQKAPAQRAAGSARLKHRDAAIARIAQALRQEGKEMAMLLGSAANLPTQHRATRAPVCSLDEGWVCFEGEDMSLGELRRAEHPRPFAGAVNPRNESRMRRINALRAADGVAARARARPRAPSDPRGAGGQGLPPLRPTDRGNAVGDNYRRNLQRSAHARDRLGNRSYSGFMQSSALQRVSEGLLGKLDAEIRSTHTAREEYVTGNRRTVDIGPGRSKVYPGRVAGAYGGSQGQQDQPSQEGQRDQQGSSGLPDLPGFANLAGSARLAQTEQGLVDLLQRVSAGVDEASRQRARTEAALAAAEEAARKSGLAASGSYSEMIAAGVTGGAMTPSSERLRAPPGEAAPGREDGAPALADSVNPARSVSFAGAAAPAARAALDAERGFLPDPDAGDGPINRELQSCPVPPSPATAAAAEMMRDFLSSLEGWGDGARSPQLSQPSQSSKHHQQPHQQQRPQPPGSPGPHRQSPAAHPRGQGDQGGQPPQSDLTDSPQPRRLPHSRLAETYTAGPGVSQRGPSQPGAAQPGSTQRSTVSSSMGPGDRRAATTVRSRDQGYDLLTETEIRGYERLFRILAKPGAVERLAEAQTLEQYELQLSEFTERSRQREAEATAREDDDFSAILKMLLPQDRLPSLAAYSSLSSMDTLSYKRELMQRLASVKSMVLRADADAEDARMALFTSARDILAPLLRMRAAERRFADDRRPLEAGTL